ncbi:23S rRNA (adenine(2503)-C(2))-methyltransferase RlmN [Nannocystis radixulma]|uniref:Probable dual-specificity RNA methyltransferase RlmN n=1 Tax=Nannocystis radixulma TaxID=2995305 RepID=A0ABT5BPL8_9BACT|nr:23S rRNA (adenine(2503)-C(2))-methyltransferase RlmN [Nannocystis radixulma]MDC0675479.1 23S rRNA (adenine(2503)-C(2))-methyltransferase RlmN [Nannocystis radixulma]
MSQLVAIRGPARGLPKEGPPNLRDLDREGLAAWLSGHLEGAPRHRAGQLFRWLHGRRVSDFSAMSDVPAADRARLAAQATLRRLDVGAVLQARDGTRKLRLVTGDGQSIESVLIPNDERGYTQCVSSQVGCALTCRFCATASLGFQRNLATWEIVDQVYQAQDLLARDPGEYAPRITNIVFMGMGEPLHNYNQVRRAVELLTDPDGAGLAARRITISSSGLVPAIERFAGDPLAKEVGLAISLNATTDAVRDEVMPINTRWNIAALLAAVRSVPPHRRRYVTFEYVLLAGVNDSDDDVRRLADLVGDIRCQINLIPFNPHPHAPYGRPSSARVRRFLDLCRAAGLRAYVRTPRGDDIGAACGQLALSGKQGAEQPSGHVPSDMSSTP